MARKKDHSRCIIAVASGYSNVMATDPTPRPDASSVLAASDSGADGIDSGWEDAAPVAGADLVSPISSRPPATGDIDDEWLEAGSAPAAPPSVGPPPNSTILPGASAVPRDRGRTSLTLSGQSRSSVSRPSVVPCSGRASRPSALSGSARAQGHAAAAVRKETVGSHAVPPNSVGVRERNAARAPTKAHAPAAAKVEGGAARASAVVANAPPSSKGQASRARASVAPPRVPDGAKPAGSEKRASTPPSPGRTAATQASVVPRGPESAQAGSSRAGRAEVPPSTGQRPRRVDSTLAPPAVAAPANDTALAPDAVPDAAPPVTALIAGLHPSSAEEASAEAVMAAFLGGRSLGPPVDASRQGAPAAGPSDGEPIAAPNVVAAAGTLNDGSGVSTSDAGRSRETTRAAKHGKWPWVAMAAALCLLVLAAAALRLARTPLPSAQPARMDPKPAPLSAPAVLARSLVHGAMTPDRRSAPTPAPLSASSSALGSAGEDPPEPSASSAASAPVDAAGAQPAGSSFRDAVAAAIAETAPPSSVTVQVVPAEAVIYDQTGRRLGKGAATVAVKPGIAITVMVLLEGYASQRVVLDGRNPSIRLSLQRTGPGREGLPKAKVSAPGKSKKQRAEAPSFNPFQDVDPL